MVRQLKPLTIELGFSIDGYLKSNLDLLEERRKKKFDTLLLFSGGEGAGKTTLACQVLYYIDRSFDLDRVYFTGEQFKDGIINAKPDTAHLLDEGYLAFAAKGVQEKMHKLLIAMLTMIRSKRLTIVIISPSFFDIDKYIAVHRSLALIRVTETRGERGNFHFYSVPKKKLLYILGKKYMNYGCVKSNFYGSFSGKWVIDEDEYERRKQKAIAHVLQDKPKSTRLIEKLRMQRDGAIKLAKRLGATRNEIHKEGMISLTQIDVITHTP